MVYESRKDNHSTLRFCAEKGCLNQTTDHRCPKCLEKHRRKHNVSEYEVSCGVGEGYSVGRIK